VSTPSINGDNAASVQLTTTSSSRGGSAVFRTDVSSLRHRPTGQIGYEGLLRDAAWSRARRLQEKAGTEASEAADHQSDHSVLRFVGVFVSTSLSIVLYRFRLQVIVK